MPNGNGNGNGKSAALKRAYQKLIGDKVAHVCPECGTPIPKYPGRYPKLCPECGASYLLVKTTKKKGSFKFCGEKSCSFEESAPAPVEGEVKPSPVEVPKQ